MCSNSDHSHKTRKQFKPIKRSGYRDGNPYKSTAKNERKNVETIISYDNYPSSSDSEDDYEDCDDDKDESYDYISLFQVWMNFLFPRAFRTQPVHRWIKSAHSVSNLRERSTGKILPPVGECSLFPKGVFVQSFTENEVTKIYFPGAQATFMDPSRPSRSHKQTK
ncbi:uncharacterized protein LOC100572689 [Acyrthosiphon pisum]|uniref:Uncharacterized protein n=1 Tax=Acyrthosiphon pisum TaxID=7029 RepID=A0A8R2FAX1_ACYPI|nr:uncharacterized protein LOC100572689 [Acyrthosiphon pisum]|eukprot:XP_008186842.1 PREDICTED: uncharacterized protein LOC100572689 [Acyrthosiphon pisum]